MVAVVLNESEKDRPGLREGNRNQRVVQGRLKPA